RKTPRGVRSLRTLRRQKHLSHRSRLSAGGGTRLPANRKILVPRPLPRPGTGGRPPPPQRRATLFLDAPAAPRPPLPRRVHTLHPPEHHPHPHHPAALSSRQGPDADGTPSPPPPSLRRRKPRLLHPAPFRHPGARTPGRPPARR